MSVGKEISPAESFMNEVKTKLNIYKSQIAAILPPGLTAEKVIQVTYNAVRKEPRLQECSATSIVGCTLMASQLGFEFDGISNKAHMVPYWNSRRRGYDAQFQIGYRGLVELALRSGKVFHMEARVVYKQDKFKCTFGSHGTLLHEPNWDGTRHDEDIMGFYAVAYLPNNLIKYDFMTKDEVDIIKNSTKQKDKEGNIFKTSPWLLHYAEMGKKTVLRRFCKSLPSDTRLDCALAWDNQAAAGERQVFDNLPEELRKENDIVIPESPAAEAEETKDLPEIKTKSQQAADGINPEDI